MLARERLSWLRSSISRITCAFRPPYRWLQCCRLFLLHRCVLSPSLLTPNQSAVPLERGRDESAAVQDKLGNVMMFSTFTDFFTSFPYTSVFISFLFLSIMCFGPTLTSLLH